MADPLLAVIGVVKEYGERVRTRALDGIDLAFEKGEFVALVGPSGSGKSTLLNIIGLLDRPTEGRVVVGGTDATGLDDDGLTALRARMLGFVFQFHHLLPAFTALENVMLPEWGDTGFPTKELRERSKAILEAVGLADRMSYLTTDLSGGQQQRVAIARALVRSPPLVLADEPTGNLDTVSSGEVFALMRRFNRESRTTFLIVTHDPRIAEKCDRVVEIVDGRVRSDRRVPAQGASPS
jgi:lipoprotein-releasing system ATP-binding protein